MNFFHEAAPGRLDFLQECVFRHTQDLVIVDAVIHDRGNFKGQQPVVKTLYVWILCKPDMVYLLDRAHGLPVVQVSSMPALGLSDRVGAWIPDP